MYLLAMIEESQSVPYLSTLSPNLQSFILLKHFTMNVARSIVMVESLRCTTYLLDFQRLYGQNDCIGFASAKIVGPGSLSPAELRDIAHQHCGNHLLRSFRLTDSIALSKNRIEISNDLLNEDRGLVDLANGGFLRRDLHPHAWSAPLILATQQQP
jgi:hypothetical protein